MADNPWDELNESKKSVSPDDENSKGGTFDFFKKNTVSRLNNEKSNKRKKIDFPSTEEVEDDFLSNINKIFSKFNPKFKFTKNLQLFFFTICFVLFFWLLSGFYTIRQEENAVILRFGKYVRDADAGLHYHLPYPIENVIKEPTTRVRVIKIGGENYAGTKSDRVLGEGWALTGDENIVNLELNVQWKIDDLKKFVFNVRDREQTIYDATQSVAREVISKRQLASILTSGRGEIEEEIKKLLQEMLNYYDMGVNILVVQMLKIDPPAQVIDSFRDVQTARVDKESEINKAYKYKNDILPKVRGEAGKMIEDANGYAIAVVNRAKGDASRFNQVYEQYKNAPFVTRKKMYLDAMEELFSKNKITIVDENVKNVFLDNKDSSIGNKEKEAITADEADSNTCHNYFLL